LPTDISKERQWIAAFKSLPCLSMRRQKAKRICAPAV
jgi:hypothetical protein